MCVESFATCSPRGRGRGRGTRVSERKRGRGAEAQRKEGKGFQGNSFCYNQQPPPASAAAAAATTDAAHSLRRTHAARGASERRSRAIERAPLSLSSGEQQQQERGERLAAAAAEVQIRVPAHPPRHRTGKAAAVACRSDGPTDCVRRTRREKEGKRGSSSTQTVPDSAQRRTR